jgi:hypothetical protein
MKKLRTILTVLFLSLVLFGMVSCEVGRHTDRGRGRRDRDHDKSGAVIIMDQDHHSDDHHDH